MIDFRYKGCFLGKSSNEEKQLALKQAAFYDTLTASFNSAFAQQNTVLSELQTRMKAMIDNPTGYSPEALAALRTQASELNTTSYLSALRSTQNQVRALGGAELPSGVNAQILAGLNASAASQESSLQNAITLANEDLKQQNFWNANNILSGVAAQYNPQGYAGAAVSAGQAASKAVYDAFHPFTAEAFGKIGMSLLGGAAAALTGGLLAPVLAPAATAGASTALASTSAGVLGGSGVLQGLLPTPWLK